MICFLNDGGIYDIDEIPCSKAEIQFVLRYGEHSFSFDKGDEKNILPRFPNFVRCLSLVDNVTSLHMRLIDRISRNILLIESATSRRFSANSVPHTLFDLILIFQKRL